MTDKYAFIRDEEGNYDVRKMCRWADVSCSGYLDWRDREPSRTARWRANLTEVVVHIFTDSERTYGYRRVHAEASRLGWPADPQTIRAIMTEQRLEAVCSRKRGPRTTIPAATGDTPDFLRRNFTSDTVGHTAACATTPHTTRTPPGPPTEPPQRSRLDRSRPWDV